MEAHSFDRHQQDVIVCEALASKDGIDPVIDIFKSNFDRNILDKHFLEMKKRIEALVLAPNDMLDALKKVPDLYEGYPERETAAQAMFFLEQSLEKGSTVKAFGVVDTLLKVYDRKKWRYHL